MFGDEEDVESKKTGMEDDTVESDVELDDSDVVQPDNDPPQKMGDCLAEVTEENRDAAQISKSQAMDAISEGKLDEAIDSLTEAIMLNPSSAILYATRATVFLKLNKPNAAIRDAEAALQINADSAKGYKVRGIARAKLGLWEAAASDLHVAAKLDYDEEIGSVLKKVEPNARKLEERRKKYERLQKERKERRERKMENSAETKTSVHEATRTQAFQDGKVIGVHSATEMESKLTAASKASRLVILYFTAAWCGPCRYISPVFTDLASKYPKDVFLKIDIDEVSDVAARWNISSVPTFFFLKNGKEIDKVVGADKSSLQRKMEQYCSGF